MRDAYCKCGIRLSIDDPGDVCLFCRYPDVPVDTPGKWLGIDSNGRKLCRCGAVVAYRSMCAPCSARNVRERRAKNMRKETR